jgi:hypothetical protein
MEPEIRWFDRTGHWREVHEPERMGELWLGLELVMVVRAGDVARLMLLEAMRQKVIDGIDRSRHMDEARKPLVPLPATRAELRARRRRRRA